MAQEIVNETQILSYTNQDFSSIYTEVLSLIKQLTYKWDPSISDESDPGVILVKLSALIADKCNYNIDKSILEAFPLSVTQDSNARQLYEQLGYYMDWYESARTNISITYTGKEVKNSEKVYTYKIPRFTIICDEESAHNYALVGTEDADGLVVSDSLLSSDGSTILVTAIEGTPVKYTYQGESVITSHMVDSVTRRLYFSSPYVSQNGVFINNVGQDNYSSWKRVNNIYEQTYNDLRYVFGYDGRSNLCYLEFPDNYAELFGSGIEITYMIIDETYENLPSQQLSQFLVPVTVTLEDDTVIDLDSSNTKIANYTASYGHKNKESINEAYINYRRTVGTFKTLITLRDYLNFIRDKESEICSNAFICDRTSDVQSTYKIMSRQNDLDTLVVKVEKLIDKDVDKSIFDCIFVKTKDDEVISSKKYYEITDDNELTEIDNPSGNPREQGWYEMDHLEPKSHDALSPFSLKFYLLRKAISLNSKSAYDETFEMDYKSPDIDALLEDTAHLEHTYEDILPLGKDTYKKTKDKSFSKTKSYYYYSKETKRYRLITDLDSYEIYYTPINIDEYEKGSIVSPASNEWYVYEDGIATKSEEDFAIIGEAYDDKVAFVQAVVTPTSRPMEYGWYEYNASEDTYFLSENERAVIGKMYYVLTEFYESHLGIPGEQYDLYELNVEALLPHIVFFKNVYPITLDISTYEAVNADTQQIIMSNVITALFENTNSGEIEFGEDVSLEYLVRVVEQSDDRIRTARFSSLDYTTKAVYYDEESKMFKTVTLDSDMSIIEPTDYQSQDAILNARFKKDILAKSVLAGTSQLIIPESTFTYHLSHKFISFLEGITNITSEAIIDFQSNDALTSYSVDDLDDYFIRKTYTLKENEIITLYRPSLTDQQQFMSGARFEYLLYNDIAANQSYKLSQGEYIVFYTQVVNDSNAITCYNVYAFTEGTIIKPALEIKAQKSVLNLTKYARNRVVTYFAINKGKTEYDTYTNNSTYMSEIRNSTIINNNVITNSESVSIQKLNTVDITTDDKYKFFWVLSNPVYSNDDNLKTFTLFEEYDTNIDYTTDINTYTLKSGEYLYYTDADEKDLHVLGPGTIITRNCGVLPDYTSYNQVHTSLYFENCDLLNVDLTKNCKYITNSKGEISPVLNGFYVVSSDISPIEHTSESPVKLGLYEDNGEYFFLSEDEEFYDEKDYYDKSIFIRSADIDIIPSVTYYLMLSHKNPGWLKRIIQDYDAAEEPIYSYISDPMASDVFESVELQDSNELINPKEMGLFEQITYNNQVLEDSYPYNDAVVPLNHPRYAASLDETVLSRNILRDIPIYSNWDISNPNSYRTLTLDEVADIPATNALNLKIPRYKEYYKSISSGYEKIEDIDYLSRPKASRWFERDEAADRYILTNDEVPLITSVYDTDISQILEEREASFGMDYANKCYFFIPNSYSQFYYYDLSKDKVELLASDSDYVIGGGLSSPIATLESIFNNSIDTEYTGGRKWLDEICDSWGTSITYNAPDTWGVPSMRQAGTWTSEPSSVDLENRYIKVTASKMYEQASLISAIYPAFTFDESPEDRQFLDADFYIPAMYISLLEITPSSENPVNYYEQDGGFTIIQDDVQLARMFPYQYPITTQKYQVYYLPIICRVKDLVLYSTSKYYMPKDYFTKGLSKPIDSWTCTAVDNNKVAADPINYISSLWRKMQYNTSLTITESELWSFAEGDSVIIEANEITDSILNWPVFSNDETAIDTTNFKLAYQRNGLDIEELDNLLIDGYSWRGYSSLLLNTSSNNGQKLYPNQSITLYGEENQYEPIVQFYGEYDADIMFQLKYPVSNKSGKFIEVESTDSLGATLPNSIYIFRSLVSKDYYQYTTDVYDTYLYFNSYLPDEDSGEPMIRSPRKIEIPVGIPWGDYLLPMTSKEGIILKAKFRQVINVNGEEVDINQIPIPLEDSLTNLKILGVKKDKYLHSFVDKERTEFVGDKLQFIEVNLDQYCKVHIPAYLTAELGMSPVELGFYEYTSDEEFIESDNEGTGVDLIYHINSVDVLTSDSPKRDYWYEYVDGSYVLSSDEKADPNKEYYRDMDFFIPINKVDSFIEFSITNDEGGSYEKQITYIIKDVFRFVKNEELGEDGYEQLFAHMRRLDDNEDYNYTFVPSTNDLISNPLLPSSFWNHNHVYNPYTIAQLDFDHIDYKFTNTK